VRLAAGSTARPIVVGNAASLDLSPPAFAKAVHEALPAKTPVLILVEGEGDAGACADYFAAVAPARAEADLPGALYAATVLANGGAGRAAEAAGARPSRAMRILVAEDNGVNRRLFARMLELAGHRVIAVANGEEALDVLDREPVDLAIFDVNMPVLNGIEAVKLHRFAHLHDPRLPIVALTADATNEGRERCLAAGFDAVVLKPIEAEELQRVVDTYAAPSRQPPGAPPPAAEIDRDGKVARHPKSGGPLPPIVDPTALEALRALYRSPAMFAELVEEFIADTGRIVDELIEAVARADVAKARDQAHALRSSAAHFGARRLHQTCVSFGRIGADEMKMRAAQLTNELKQGYALVVEVLRREVPQAQEIRRA
jgi:two-component system sensor histidine kinase RpfC